mmetsp:Transcript_18162/g.31285  ORF Transcript_18162/g.31285 Transcript_18162/m.31285 type:complete len:112 (+) Transcript_18162:244-579(+)
MLKRIVKIAPTGIVMSNEHAVAIEVANRYLPCAPRSAQDTIPIFMVTLPKAINGNDFEIIDLIVASLLSQDSRVLLKQTKMLETKVDVITAMSIDLYAENLASTGFPFPIW